MLVVLPSLANPLSARLGLPEQVEPVERDRKTVAPLTFQAPSIDPGLHCIRGSRRLLENRLKLA